MTQLLESTALGLHGVESMVLCGLCLLDETEKQGKREFPAEPPSHGLDAVCSTGLFSAVLLMVFET